jgi:hypothetical protein
MSSAVVWLLLAACAALLAECDAQRYKRPPVPKMQPPLCKVNLKADEQCGGSGGMCSKYPYDLKLCQDAPFQKACCPKGYSCQRYNSGWFDCKPTKVERTPPFPLLASLPPKSKLPKPVYIDSNVTVNGRPKHRYLLIKYATDWMRAEAICQYYYKRHLASVHDIGEMWRINNRCYARMRDMCWIGASDMKQRGLFRWTDGSSWDFAFWQQVGGVSVTPADRCVALQDGFQTWPCKTKFAIACQVY